MSRTQNLPGDTRNSPKDSYVALSRMLREGRSWSGRERNCAFLNTRDGRFANISATSGFDFPDDARAVAVVDWDQDGDQDLWVTNRNEPRLRFLRNMTEAGASVELLLLGNGSTTNADAIGARVELETEGDSTRQIRTRRAGEGYLAQSSAWLHFGLGNASRVSRVLVRWPAGPVEEFSGVEPGGRYRLVQGAGKAQSMPRRSRDLALRASTPVRPPESSVARIPLLSLMKLPLGLTYERFGGVGPAPVEAKAGRGLLIVLFASWCAPCARELEQFTKGSRELEAARLDVLALSVDGLGDDRSDPAKAAQLISRLEFPFQSGQATALSLAVLQKLNDTHVPFQRPLPVPSSFLVDRAGRLSVIYKGPAALAQVLKDLDRSTESRRERFLQAAPLGGTALDHPSVENAARLSEVSQRFLLALELSEKGFADAAREHYQDVVALKPDFAEAQVNLGLLSFRSGDLPLASRSFRAAIAARPDLPDGHYNLGLLLERQGALGEAEAAYKETLRLRPEYPEAHDALGLIYAKTNRLDAARAEFEAEAISHPSSAEAQNNLGLVHLNQGREPDALRHFDAAVKLNPRHADAHNNRGVLLRRQGRLEEAREAYKLAVLSNPRFAEAHNNLGALYRAQGQLEEARQEFLKALEIDPGFELARKNLEKLQ